MHAIHATNEVEKTLAFYRDVFGVSGQVRDFANQAVPILTNSPGVTLKVSMLNLPGQGFNFELTQFSNVERHPGAAADLGSRRAAHEDPGARPRAGGGRGQARGRADPDHLRCAGIV